MKKKYASCLAVGYTAAALGFYLSGLFFMDTMG